MCLISLPWLQRGFELRPWKFFLKNTNLHVKTCFTKKCAPSRIVWWFFHTSRRWAWIILYAYDGTDVSLSFKLEFTCSNNEPKWESLIKGESGDSRLIVKNEEFALTDKIFLNNSVRTCATSSQQAYWCINDFCFWSWLSWADSGCTNNEEDFACYCNRPNS